MKLKIEICLIISTNVADENSTCTMTQTNLYVPVVTLSTQDNAKLLTQLESCLNSLKVGINIYQTRIISIKCKFKSFN